MLDTLIAGRVVTPDGIIEEGWVGIRGERIAAIGDGEPPQARRAIDHTGSYVLPGTIDGQTHAGSQIGFAGLAPTSRAAVMGGVTTIVDMPYDEPDPITTAALLKDKIAAVEAYSICDVALYGTVPAHPNANDVQALVEEGVCAFKISSFEAHPHRFPRIDNASTRYLIELLESSGLPLGLHNEDQEIVRRFTQVHRDEGRTGPEFHSPSRPEVAELAATAAFLALGAGVGTPLHIVHISTPDGFALVRRARETGKPATAEMCVHYLHFDGDEDMRRLGGLLKVNPPIRPDRKEALWSVLEQNGCAFVSSDHSAWPLERKNLSSIFDVAAGMPGLETLLPVFFSDAAERYGADEAARLCASLLAERPAAFFGLSRKGRLQPGLEADVTVLQPGPYRYDAKANPNGPGWSAYDGETFAARPVATFVRGRQVWDGAAIAPQPGRYVPRG